MLGVCCYGSWIPCLSCLAQYERIYEVSYPTCYLSSLQFQDCIQPLECPGLIFDHFTFKAYRYCVILIYFVLTKSDVYLGAPFLLSCICQIWNELTL